MGANSKEGPVPVDVLEEQLSVAVQAVQDEAQQVAGKDLIGCELGYHASPTDSEELGEPYSVAWGDEIPRIEEISEYEEEISEDEIKLDPAENPLSFAFIDQLVARLQAEIIERTPPENLRGRSLHVYILGTFTHNPCGCFGVQCCTKSNGDRGKWRLFCRNGECKHTRCRGSC